MNPKITPSRSRAVMMSDQPSPAELYQQAAGDRERYAALMAEHGYLIEGKREPLPCGWPGKPRVYVDDYRRTATVGRIRGRWSHLTADTPEALHDFAARIGLRREWFQARCKHASCPVRDGVCAHFHYDVVDAKRTEAIAAGAEAIGIREMGAITSARRPYYRSDQDGMDTVGTLRPKLARLAESENAPAVRVIERSREELLADRARLIAKSGMSEAMLFERGKSFDLYPEHRSIYEMVTSIDFLLGDSKPAQDHGEVSGV